MFVELVITEERKRAEALSDALLEAGALSVSIEDADAGSLDEQPLYGEPGTEPEIQGWNRSRVVALFDGDFDIDAALRAALSAAGIGDVPIVERRDVADANWVALTQAQFDPIAIGKHLWIVPSWHQLPSAADEPEAIVLRLDPGMAFGTGDHPTTRLCLAWLEENLADSESVIDYGCGSGILAIAAKKLGAGLVVGTDIDDQAISAARANARDNHAEIAFTSSKEFASEPADVVVANILSNPLKVLAPLLTSLVRPGGRLVLSGVLERQWQDVAAAYGTAITLTLWASESGWVCLAGRRPTVREAS
jgi:ribosomal protein L11 methyltransferase